MNYNRNNRFGGRRDSGGRNMNSRGSGKPAMFKTTCTECGQDCEVPFKPTGNKPVLCSYCFKGKGNAGPKRAGGGRDSGRARFEDKREKSSVCNNEVCKAQFEQLNQKLDMILEELESIRVQKAIQDKAEIIETYVPKKVKEELPKKPKKAAASKKASAKKAEATKKPAKKKAVTKKTAAKKKK
ncbi:CxxC-x17-CxxC domain-containing protein [Candidatus Margulisiibacteriota bacterium]